MASTLENVVTHVKRDPVIVASKANFIAAGMFSSSMLSSPSSASKSVVEFTAVNFQDPLHLSPAGPVRKYSARPPTVKS